jgi:hypothetical protein
MYTVLWEFPRSWLPIIGIAVPVFTMVVFSYKTGNRLFYRKPWTIVTFALIILAGVFMFAMPHNAYGWAHTLWHIFSMLAAWTFELATDPGSPDGQQLHAEFVLAQARDSAPSTRRPVSKMLANDTRVNYDNTSDDDDAARRRQRPTTRRKRKQSGSKATVETTVMPEIPRVVVNTD